MHSLHGEEEIRSATLTEEPFYVRKTKQADAKKLAKKDLQMILESRTPMFAELTSAVSTAARAAIASQARPRQEDEDIEELWCRVLKVKLGRMDHGTLERFKVMVDTEALKALDGDWEWSVVTPVKMGKSPKRTPKRK